MKCPKCGRVGESCEHVSKEDMERVVRLLKAGVEVYESEEDLDVDPARRAEPLGQVRLELQRATAVRTCARGHPRLVRGRTSSGTATHGIMDARIERT